MTLISFEGPSRSGKSTVAEILKERFPSWIEVTGRSLPERTADNFCEAWRQELELRKPIFEANPDNVFLAERQFSEIAYAHDEDVRQYVKRTLAMWTDVKIVYLTASDETLSHRNSPDSSDISERYEPVLDTFPHCIINTGEHEPRVVANKIEEFVHD